MKKIMIVDDDLFARELLIDYLNELFELLDAPGKIMPEIIQAEDASYAWSLLIQDKIVPSLMIIDFQMPGMNGDKFIDKIRKELKLDSELVLHSDYYLAGKEAEKLNCRFIPKIGGQKEIFDLALGLGLFAL